MRFRCAICGQCIDPVSIEKLPFQQRYRFWFAHYGYGGPFEATTVELNTVTELKVFTEEASRALESRRLYKPVSLLQLKRRRAQRSNGLPFRLVLSPEFLDKP